MPRPFAFSFAALALAAFSLAQAADGPPVRLPVAPPPHLPGRGLPPDLTTEDIGLDPKLEAALPAIERLPDVVPQPGRRPVAPMPHLPGKGLAKEAIDDDLPLIAPPVERVAEPVLPPGLGVTNPLGLDPLGLGAPGNVPGDEVKSATGPFPGRSGATKTRLLKEGGGNAASELAVARGLAWLAKQQQQDGGWKFDTRSRAEDRASATGMALLPFLGAGVTHKKPKEKGEKDYDQVVAKGVQFLVKQCPVNGADAGRLSKDVYANAIAALALVEAYGMTNDPALKPHAQAAVNFIQKTQGSNGSWGYGNSGNGDTSIFGWQVQVLQAAKLSKELVVDDRVLARAVKFLDFAAAGAKKSMYGYNDNANAAPGTALTAVGLLCRYYISSWGPTHPGLIDGVTGLMKNAAPANGGIKNLYYFYYAAQVVHFYEGEDWKTWNEGPKQADGTRKGGMRDWLAGQQKKDGGNSGSWDPEAGWFGSSCGRLGTTAMSVLTLEVYYRHLPLYKRGADGKAVPITDDKK